MALPPRPSPEQRAQKAAAAGAKSRLFDPDLVKPSAVSNLSPIAGARAGATAGGSLPASGEKKSKPKAAAPIADRPPFRPCNPTGAREAITLEKTGFVGMHSPFDLGYRQRQKERQEASARRIGGTFLPPSGQQAKDDTRVNYFLNSPDAETIEAERRYIQEKVRGPACTDSSCLACVGPPAQLLPPACPRRPSIPTFLLTRRNCPCPAGGTQHGRVQPAHARAADSDARGRQQSWQRRVTQPNECSRVGASQCRRTWGLVI